MKCTSIIKITTIGNIIAIFIIYSLAQYYKHVNSWIPLISDCLVYPPERYIARITLPIFWTFGAYISQLGINFRINRHSIFDHVFSSLLTSSTSVLSLCILAISEHEDKNLHDVCATLYFALMTFYITYITLKVKYYNILSFVCLSNYISILCFISYKKHIFEWILFANITITFNAMSDRLNYQYINFSLNY